MGTQFTIDELANFLVSPAYFSSEEEKDMDVDILSVSAQGTERHSDDSDIEVIACYRHVPIAPTKQNATRKMTTDLSSCVDDGLPEFPWDDFSDFWPEDFQTAIVELGTGPDAIGRENNCPIVFSLLERVPYTRDLVVASECATCLTKSSCCQTT